MKHSQINQIDKISRAVGRGSFKFNQLCEPNLIGVMVAQLKKLAIEEHTVGEFDEMNRLTKAASSKRASTPEYVAFQAACTPKKIKHWCEICIEDYKKNYALKAAVEDNTATS